MWSPDPETLTRPRYKALADALARDVAEGRLAPGTRLPTQRDLAERLGVTVGTITRAYAEAAERGVIEATVGRGTFVRSRPAARPRFHDAPYPPHGAPEDSINLAMNRPALGPHAEVFARTVAAVASDRASANFAALMDYAPPAGLPRHREAGARFFAELGHDVPPERVLVTCGAQSALSAVMAALGHPGDEVLVEGLTYPGILAAAHQCRLGVRALPLDGEGLIPDGIELAARTGRPRLLVCVPNHHNPTAVVMPEARRRRIAALARAHDLIVLEDDVYGFLIDDRPPAIAAFAPERTCLVTSTSKSLLPGLRVGFLAAPAALAPRLAASLRVSGWTAPPLMAEITARLVADGSARELMAWQKDEARARQTLAQASLSRFHPSAYPSGFHLWLPLPRPWNVGAFTAALRERGVTLAPSEAFVAGDAPVPQAVRLCLTAPRSRAELSRGLEIVAALLSASPAETLSTI